MTRLLVTLLVCLSLVGWAQSFFEEKARIQAGTTHIREELFKFDNAMQGLINRHNRELDTNSSDCTATLSALVTAYSSCNGSGLVSTLVSYFDFKTVVADADVTTFCASSCLGNVNVALEAFAQSSCRASLDTSLTVNFKLVTQLTKIPCVKLSTTFCFPVYKKLLTVYVGTNNMTDVAVKLKLYCSSCISAVNQAIFEYGTSSVIANFWFLNALCVQDRGSYCFSNYLQVWALYPQILKVASNPISNSIPVATLNNFFQLACGNRCIKKILSLNVTAQIAARPDSRETILSDPTSGGVLGFLDGLCKTNTQNKYCLATAIQLNLVGLLTDCGVSVVTSPSVSVTLPKSCSTSCGPYLKNSILTPLSCCAGSFFDSHLLQSIGIQAQDIIDFLALCSLTVPPSCPAATDVSGHLRLTNLDFTYVSKFMDTVTADVTLDVASVCGVPSTQVSTLTVAQVDGSTATDVTWTITPDNNLESAYIASDLTTMIQDGSIVFPIVSSSYPPSSKNDPSAAMSVDQSQSLVVGAPLPTVASSSSSSSTGPSGGGGSASVFGPAFGVLAALFSFVLCLL